MKKDFDGFSIELFQEEDGDWAAYLEELPNVSAFGDTPENALEELKTAWELMKESYIKNNQPLPVAPSQKSYSGQFNVRLDRRLHKALAIEAARFGVSLNALVSQKLQQSSKTA